MRKILFLIFFFFIVEIASAMRSDSARAELVTLLKERKVLSDEYYSSLNKKSGFFGNQTKNDIRLSQEKLVEIVKEDNKIMNVLNRIVDYRNFEKSNMTYDVNSYEERIKNLSILNDTLNKQVLALDEEKKLYVSTIKLHRLYFIGLIIILIVIVTGWIRKYFRK